MGQVLGYYLHTIMFVARRRKPTYNWRYRTSFNVMVISSCRQQSRITKASGYKHIISTFGHVKRMFNFLFCLQRIDWLS
jgi:hypothetical protein